MLKKIVNVKNKLLPWINSDASMNLLLNARGRKISKNKGDNKSCSNSRLNSVNNRRKKLVAAMRKNLLVDNKKSRKPSKDNSKRTNDFAINNFSKIFASVRRKSVSNKNIASSKSKN